MPERGAYASWGGLQRAPAAVLTPASAGELRLPSGRYLAYGAGRSYGDSCFPADGTLIDMRGLSRLLAFDRETGVVRVEAGMLLGDLIGHLGGSGWFPPVVPGTRFVTIGGAIANDIHGKNHHAAGSFGRHVRAFELLRSDGRRLVCSAEANPELFAATIGGMGLTGVVLWAEIGIKRVRSPDVVQYAEPISSLGDFFRLAEAADRREYAVAWIDSLATGGNLGRGVMLSADHAASGQGDAPSPARFAVPFQPPVGLINRLSLKVFNIAYRWNALRRAGPQPVGWRPFFFPLDAVGHWNRLYGPRGLRQHQSVVPMAGAEQAVRALLEATHRAGEGSFLTVLKVFGDRPSPGLLSFARPGVTLTLDFPYRGAGTDRLLARLDEITLAAGGAVNPYKDARMSAETFRASFPNWAGIRPLLDANARSLFSVRVGLTD
jgi:FAD/FMN-containing dehydrogenase